MSITSSISDGPLGQKLLPWQDIAQAKQTTRDAKIPDEWRLPSDLKFGKNVINVPVECGILTPEEVEITSSYDATGLVERLRTGILKCEAVVTAFCKRAAIAQQLVNCLTEINFKQAIARAQSLDKQREGNPSHPLPPLFGLPISLKDSFCIPGLDTTCGFVSLAKDPATEASTLVQLLLDLGAVLYCKTNVPQTMMTADSDNNLFGRTLNPHDTTKTAGGSTGGEGALIALRGSILGVGTDIAGSIRIPSICCGIYGFKPSIATIPYQRQRRVSLPGVEGVKPVAGPMATSARDFTLFMRAIMQAEPWRIDTDVSRFGWVESTVPPANELIIGLVRHNSMHTPHPPVVRALAEAAEKLQAAGVKVVDLELPNVSKHIDELYKFYAIGGIDVMANMVKASGEPWVPSVQMTALFTGAHPTPLFTIADYFDMFHQRELAVRQYQDLFIQNRLDAILMPGAATTALPWDTWASITYTGLWNYVDRPACIIPVGKVGREDVCQKFRSEGTAPDDERNYDLYTSPEDYMGLPITLQLVGNRQGDEDLARIAEILDGVLRPTASSDKSTFASFKL